MAVFLWFVLGVALVQASPGQRLDGVSRRTVPFPELLDYKWFNSTVYNYTTFWLEEGRGVLYVGARGAIYALNLSDISDNSTKVIQWEAPLAQRTDCLSKRGNTETECFNHVRFLKRFNGTHLFTCGTFAFRPRCAYIDTKSFTLSSTFEGKEKCPYNPSVGYTGLIVDDKVYTATLYEFRGTVADIKRNLYQRSLRTSDASPRWLSGADFVESTLVRESANSSVGDDDKIYFFFTENLSEEMYTYDGLPMVTRVARVCKNDEGGMRTLQRKWTSFLKARVVCSIPEYNFHFNILKSVWGLDRGDWRSTVFYAVFTSQWRNIDTSAVCQYSISGVRKPFEGPFKEDQASATWWSRYSGAIPEPRPGSCITDQFRKLGFQTSRDLPDVVLDFVKKHPVMDEDVTPEGGRPLLVRKNVNYTKIAVDTVTGLDNMQYDVLFIGTADGWLHKIVKVGLQVHTIEELQVYKDPQPVESVVISRIQRMVYVGSRSSVIQLPRASCSKYTGCQDCILARDPDCGWDGEACRQITENDDRSQLTQDIVNGNNGCLNSSKDVHSQVRNKTVVEGSTILLECQFRSNLAFSKWRFNRKDLSLREAERYTWERQALLIKAARDSDSGEYRCYAEENGLEYLVVLYMVRVVESFQPEVPPSHMAQISSGREFLYLTIIVFLGAVAVVTSILSIYLFCSPSKRGKYQVQLGRPSLIELQNVSGRCGPRSEGGAGEEDHQMGVLKIIPGQAPSVNSFHNNNRTVSLELPPPPPPPPLPPDQVDTPNGLPGLPHVLRKMNGNSYMLLRQASEMESTSPHYHSFTEELNRKLEKRKHAQLGEKPDESSV